MPVGTFDFKSGPSGRASGSRQRAGGAGNGTKRSRGTSMRGGSTGDALEGVPAEVVGAFLTLRLLPTAWPELVKSAHRIAAKRLHPDVGGDHHAMVAANLAAERALAWAEGAEKRDPGEGQSGVA